MIVRSFLAWTATAPAAARAEGASALARAYVADELDAADRSDAESALTVLLDDQSPLVRLELAKALCQTTAVPHHLVTALISDRADIAAIVLASSPILDEDELIDAIAVGDAVTQSAVAGRPYLTAAVAGAIAEVASLPACQVLCSNGTASIAPVSLTRLVERFGHDALLRDLLGDRDDLDPGHRHDLAVATAQVLEQFVTTCGWLSAERAGRVTREAEEQAALTLATATIRSDGMVGVRHLVEHLAAAGRLTPALLLRAILCGDLPLFETALSSLSGVPIARVAGLVQGQSKLGFAALYAKAKLPAQLMPVFETAVREAGRGGEQSSTRANGPRRSVIGKVLAALAPGDAGALGKVTALLRSLEAQAARDEARSFTVDLARERQLPALPRPMPSDRALPIRSAA